MLSCRLEIEFKIEGFFGAVQVLFIVIFSLIFQKKLAVWGGKEPLTVWK